MSEHPVTSVVLVATVLSVCAVCYLSDDEPVVAATPSSSASSSVIELTTITPEAPAVPVSQPPEDLN